MKSKLYILALALFGLIACEKVLDIDIADKEHKFVINGLLNPDSLIKVNVSKSLNVLDTKDYKFINDASVKLYRDGNFVENLINIGQGNYASISNYAQQGSLYQIEVENNQTAMASAEAMVPQKDINAIQVDTMTTIYEQDYYSQQSIKCTIHFNDVANQDDYYWFSIYGMQEYFNWNSDTIFKDTSIYKLAPIYFDSDDPIIEGWLSFGSQGIIFSDKLFDGQNKQFDIYLDKYLFYGIDTNVFHFNLNIIDKDFYLYALTHDIHLDAQEDPFTEPVQVYTNIENGYGIFSGYTTVSDSIAFTSYFDDGIIWE